jgi:hypothetical protein
LQIQFTKSKIIKEQSFAKNKYGKNGKQAPIGSISDG